MGKKTNWQIIPEDCVQSARRSANILVAFEVCSALANTHTQTHTHFHTLRAKEMGYYVKDCIFFCRLHASRFSHFTRFCHSLHLLINGLSVRGSREVKLITLIDFEANKPKTRTHPPKSNKKKIEMTKNTARDLSDIPVEVQKKYWLLKYQHSFLDGGITFMQKT